MLRRSDQFLIFSLTLCVVSRESFCGPPSIMKKSRSVPARLDDKKGPSRACFSRTTIRIIVLLVLWFSSSSFQNIWGKAVLKKLPYPMTLTMAQFSIINVVLPMLMTLWNKRRRTFTRRQYITGLIPLSMLKLLGSLSSFLTLLKVPVSYAHTVKALMPLCSVVLSRLILNEHHSWRIYACLLPIVMGVILASKTELEFNLTGIIKCSTYLQFFCDYVLAVGFSIGLLAALSSTVLLSSQTIFSKKFMGKIDHLNLLLVCSRIAALLFLPLWLYKEGYSLLFGHTFADLGISTVSANEIVLMLLAASLCNCVQTIAAFTFLSLVPPVTYSVANVSKRVVVITLSIVYFGQSATSLNVLGMASAISGVGLYNYVKIWENKQKTKFQLPTNAVTSSRPADFNIWL